MDFAILNISIQIPAPDARDDSMIISICRKGKSMDETQDKNYLSLASVLSCSIWSSNSTHADWISMFFKQSSLHCTDKALSSYAVFC